MGCFTISYALKQRSHQLGILLSPIEKAKVNSLTDITALPPSFPRLEIKQNQVSSAYG